MSMDVFRKLGEELELRWRQRDYAGSAFPDLAAASLEGADEVEAIGTWDILRWIAREPALPAQQDPRSQFSDLAITFYEAPRFFVSGLMWLDGTTAIHQHSFSGAFRVLAGSSLQTRYRFRETRLVNDRFRLGALDRERVELLATGSVRPIVSGQGLIHSLFHLDRPSVTLIVRTKCDEGTRPQWSYHAPGIAIDPFFEDPVTTKKLEAVRVFLSLDSTAADVELHEMLAACDLQTTFQILSSLFHQVAATPLKRAFGAESGERFERLIGQARKRHGSAVDLFEQAFHEQRRQHEIIGVRGSLKSPEHRFLLALLLNVADRREVLALIAQRYPDRDPVDTFADWVDELSKTRELGSLFPNVLRIPDFDVEHLVVLRRLLRGGSVADAASDLCAALPTEDPASVGGLTERIVASFRDASLLRAMFREP